MLQTLGEALDAADGAAAADAVGADEVAADADAAADAPVQASKAALPEVWILELSSFQLDGVTGFEPSVATVLNITQDHLDWHGSMPAYVAAKGRIFGERTVRVVNADDALVESLATAPPPAPPVALDKAGKPVRVAKAKAVRAVPPRIVRFGLSAPRRPGDFGLVVDHGMAWLARAQPADETLRSRPRAVKAVADEAVEISIQPLMPADALRVRGRHNAANALAALALATAIGCALAPMLHGLREYRGEPHRVEFIAQIDGIDAFDDSKGTNVGATVAALDGLGADRAPAKLVVLLGGDGKGQDFGPLVEPLRRHARAIATIGRDAAAIESVIAEVGVPTVRHPTLEAATRWCFEQARAGDAVLLSPACASFDMFRNYPHRAAVFVAEVHAIAAERGGPVA
jgi:UDP-N-acetylmuramoylalanine--D-glutamate ligase